MNGPFEAFAGHEQVVYGADEATGLRCIIAIHSTALGPALGGTRCHPYATEEEALHDVLRLSSAMTYKAAVAGLDVGGGKAVIIADPATKSEALLRAYGRFVETLNGRYVTACDVGTYPDDMAHVRRETRWASGAPLEEGGSGDSGVSTAVGTMEGLHACAEEAWGDPSLRGRHVAIQGVGKVGRRLAAALADEGAKLTVADVDDDATAHCVEAHGAEVAPVDKVHAVDCDVFSPNAMGGAINAATLAELSCRVVAGAANNQLAAPELATAMDAAGILYAPDYVINAGGLIQVADEFQPGGYTPARAQRRIRGIRERLGEVFAVARTDGVTTETAALRVAERRIAAVGGVRRIRTSGDGLATGS